MKIKSYSDIVTAIFICIAIFIAMLNYYQSTQLRLAMENIFLANEIVKVVSQRENIAKNYVNSNDSESIILWQLMYNATKRLLQSPSFTSVDEKQILEDLREQNINANRLFTSLVILHNLKSKSKISSDESYIIQQNIVRDLVKYGSSITTGAYRISEMSQQENIRISRDISFYTWLSVIILIMLTSSYLIFLRLRVVFPLIKLNEGIKRIDSGDFDFRISPHRSDEIGEIMQAANEMSEKLKFKTLDQTILIDKLKSSNDELKQFIYIASHDLQEPLRMIASFLQLIERRYKGRIDKDADDFINYAVTGSVRLQNMITDLLIFSHIETHDVVFSAIKMDDALNSALENMHLAIKENHAVVLHDALPVVNADQTQMTIVFQNLISNAIKFHSDKNPIINIKCSELPTEWRISVQDNGMGIDPKYHDRLFIIFKRLVGREYPGSGIGLAICKRIIERHHGKIWVESQAGVGSTFYFTLPK